MEWTNILFIVAGVWSIICGVTQIGVNFRKMQRMIRLIGEAPTRILYVIIGVALIIMSFLIDFSAA